MKIYDIAIIGAGPAGMTAAIYGARSGKSVVLFEGLVPGGQIVNTPEVQNHPGFVNIKGFELATKMFEAVQNLAVDVRFEAVTSAELEGDIKTVVTDSESYSAKTVIIANGVKRRKLDIPGEGRYLGRGVSYCATCDGGFFADKAVAVVGGGNTAFEDAIYLTSVCKKVYIVHRRNEFRGHEKSLDIIKAKGNIEIVTPYIPVEIVGDDSAVTSLKLESKEDGAEKVIECDGVFIAVGMLASNDIFSVEKEDEFIVGSEDCTTNIPGVFVAGDTRVKQLRQLVTAEADGAIAASAAAMYIETM